MSGKGNCYDNAAVETFFKTIKAELIWRRSTVMLGIILVRAMMQRPRQRRKN
jgi:transposase InsO family protein